MSATARTSALGAEHVLIASGNRHKNFSNDCFEAPAALSIPASRGVCPLLFLSDGFAECFLHSSYICGSHERSFFSVRHSCNAQFPVASSRASLSTLYAKRSSIHYIRELATQTNQVRVQTGIPRTFIEPARHRIINNGHPLILTFGEAPALRRSSASFGFFCAPELGKYGGDGKQ